MAEQKTDSKSIFKHDEFKPYKPSWEERVRVLSLRGDYYTGKVYKKSFDAFKGFMGGTDRVKGVIKPLYLPLASAVDIDVGLIPGGWKVDTDLVSDELIEQVRLLLAQSNFKTLGTLYVEYGAKYGLSGLKVSDLREDKIVQLSPVDPLKFMPIWGEGYSKDPQMVIYLEDRDEAGENYEYGEVTTPELIRTYRDGDLYSYEEGRGDTEENTLKEVPYIQVKHIENGDIYGESTFEKAIPMLNEVNSTATNLGEIIQKHAEPQWMVNAEPTDLTKSGDNVWFFPEGGDAKPLVAPIDISGVLEFIREIAGNVKGALPESAFEELQKKKMIATETLEIQLYPLVIKIKHRCRPNYDDGMERALQMAGRAGVDMGLEGPWAELANGDVQIDEERAVLPLDPMTQLRFAMLQREAERTDAFFDGDNKMDDFADDLDEDDDQDGDQE